jgi:uncharacterized HAD superfamily protein
MSIPPDAIAFDIDGVIADTFRVFVDMARNEYGCRFTYEDITEYDFLTVLDMSERISNEIIQALLDHPIESGIRPVQGAVEVLTRLSRKGPLFFVTARPEKEAILEWVFQHLPRVDRDLIRLEATATSKRKPPVLLENGVRYFVEDRLETCHLLQEASITPIVFDQPWNRKRHPFLVARNWDELSAMMMW